jgi:hypothetical protein
MITPKDFGKLAKRNGINAPTLDEDLSHWLARTKAERVKDYYVQWWEGWYEALDESLSRAPVTFTNDSR